MSGDRPDTAKILAHLKDFQRDTVEYVFQRLYRDDDCTRRFLIADEVGLGKTLVARGIIAKTIDHLWDHTRRIDVVYVCSNADIARQNINRLNVTGHDDFCLSSRITLLPLNLADMQRRRVNFVSFTPGTSFELSRGAGQSLERELLYQIIHDEHDLPFVKASRLFEAGAKTDAFRERLKVFAERQPTPHPKIARMFLQRLQEHPDLWQRFTALCDAMPRAGVEIPSDINRARNRLIGGLRRLMAESCLNWLEPDLIILDEFQRFKQLLDGESEESSEAAQLAHHLFNYQQSQHAPTGGARVLLLSATPYKMYTLAREQAYEDHYIDFERTLSFLLPSHEARTAVSAALRRYREELLRVSQNGKDGLLSAKRELEALLSRVMVRTERLATTADRNGMLAEIDCAPQLNTKDIQTYLGLQAIARSVDQGDAIEYWKSAPYLLNFMDEYELKRRVLKQLERPDQGSDVVQAFRQFDRHLLNKDEIEQYKRLDPANARMRSLQADTVMRGAWRLLWVPPSLPYYQPSGSFADPEIANFTKRLVFSCWRVVPKAVSSLLSYEAEREMMHSFRRRSRNTSEARKKRRALLRFMVNKGRLTGMPVLGLIYPCRTLATRFDPLPLGRRSERNGTKPSLSELTSKVAAEIRSLLAVEFSRADQSGPADEAWYWAALLMLDKKYHRREIEDWFAQPDLAEQWRGRYAADDPEALHGWPQHLKAARDFLAGRLKLGVPPPDLCEVLAGLALAGPAVTSLRALERAIDGGARDRNRLRNAAAVLAHSFLHLFNLPEVMALVRDRKRELPYWRSVLQYCGTGNLQATLDEYSHVLVDSQGSLDGQPEKISEAVSQAMQNAISLRTSTAQADVFAVRSRRVERLEPLRLRTRFAMRFGDQDVEDSAEPTRADHVRAAFNSPFWPFVLCTTSVGQEGLDFHTYCHAIVHWNLPSNPVDLEQREGRVHRYKGHALRKNIAARFGHVPVTEERDIWATMFSAARKTRAPDQNDLYPFWISLDGPARIERHVPALPLSREMSQKHQLNRSLVVYRMVFGQNRQEDLVRYLLDHVSPDRIAEMFEHCRISLVPPTRDALSDTLPIL